MSALSERLEAIAQSLGWESAKRVWWSGAIRGQWRGFNVEWRHMARYKSTPERLQLTITVEAPGRIIIKRRAGIFSKPITWFGPALVEPASFTQREEYWIRADPSMPLDALFSRKEIVAAIDENLIAGFDLVALEARRLRIFRALDDTVVKKKFNRPFFQWGKDLDFIERVAREEWALAIAIIEALGLRPLR